MTPAAAGPNTRTGTEDDDDDDDDLVERPSTHAGLSGLLTPTTPGWNAPPPVCHLPLSSGAM